MTNEKLNHDPKLCFIAPCEECKKKWQAQLNQASQEAHERIESEKLERLR